MKQPNERAAFRIKSTQVRSLVRIAVVAGESEVKFGDKVSRIEFQGFDRLEDAQAFCEKNALVAGQWCA